MPTQPISIRIGTKKLDRLDHLARATNRPRSSIIRQAIDSYLDQADWFTREVKRGIAEADSGPLIPHNVLMRELKTRRRKTGCSPRPL